MEEPQPRDGQNRIIEPLYYRYITVLMSRVVYVVAMMLLRQLGRV